MNTNLHVNVNQDELVNFGMSTMSMSSPVDPNQSFLLQMENAQLYQMQQQQQQHQQQQQQQHQQQYQQQQQQQQHPHTHLQYPPQQHPHAHHLPQQQPLQSPPHPQQSPPHQVMGSPANPHLMPQFAAVPHQPLDLQSPSKNRNRGNYRCSRCGEPKKGHVCPLIPANFKCNRCGNSKKTCTCEALPTRDVGTQVEVDPDMTTRVLDLSKQSLGLDTLIPSKTRGSRSAVEE